MRRFLLSSLLAASLLVATASTALMATVTNKVCGNATSDLSYTYDDQSLLILSAIAHNDATATVPLTIRLTRPSDQVVIFSRRLSIGTGVTVYDLVPQNQHMVASVDKLGSPSVVAPFNAGCSWG